MLPGADHRHLAPCIVALRLGQGFLDRAQLLRSKLRPGVRRAIQRIDRQLALRAAFHRQRAALEIALRAARNRIEQVRVGALDLRQVLDRRLGHGAVAGFERQSHALPGVLHAEQLVLEHRGKQRQAALGLDAAGEPVRTRRRQRGLVAQRDPGLQRVAGQLDVLGAQARKLPEKGIPILALRKRTQPVCPQPVRDQRVLVAGQERQDLRFVRGVDTQGQVPVLRVRRKRVTVKRAQLFGKQLDVAVAV
jgi:hypothetical protein